MALVEVTSQAQAERAAAQAELEQAPGTASAAELYAMIDSLGDVQDIVNSGDTDRLAALYAEIGLEVLYQEAEEAVYVTASPRVNSVCPRGDLNPHAR
ncbi:hypothetical protein V5P93_007212 [Actinokineospora auranticolor]|uniref:hypothetical protein n=1 Tax=Actinokineospora auranticolor TaxID=155976 RepID=UPI000CEC1393|nr:hypothetical protein [Actinokineospora auranticolor]